MHEVEILYLSCYPEVYYNEIQQLDIEKISQPSQKFNYLMARGFSLNGNKVTVLNTYDDLAAIKSNYHKETINWNESDMSFDFLPLIQDREINRTFVKKKIKAYIERWEKEHPHSCIVIDALRPYCEYVYKYTKRIPIITIVTDLPEHLYMNYDIKSFIRRHIKIFVFSEILKRSSAYVFLTEMMDRKLNRLKKPYVVIEGLIDSEFEIKKPEEKSGKFVCLYSGALHERYGVKNLVEAFCNEQLADIELHLYGNGDYVDRIKHLHEKHFNIRYFGVVDSKTILSCQHEASLLINPRPADEEFAVYSFPSKNMEYMLSGTPVLTTELPGMPREYKSFVYLLHNNSSETIRENILRIVNQAAKDRIMLAENAQTFVLRNKNNIIQSKKILTMMERI